MLFEQISLLCSLLIFENCKNCYSIKITVEFRFSVGIVSPPVRPVACSGGAFRSLYNFFLTPAADQFMTWCFWMNSPCNFHLSVVHSGLP